MSKTILNNYAEIQKYLHVHLLTECFILGAPTTLKNRVFPFKYYYPLSNDWVDTFISLDYDNVCTITYNNKQVGLKDFCNMYSFMKIILSNGETKC